MLTHHPRSPVTNVEMAPDAMRKKDSISGCHPALRINIGSWAGGGGPGADTEKLLRKTIRWVNTFFRGVCVGC